MKPRPRRGYSFLKITFAASLLAALSLAVFTPSHIIRQLVPPPPLPEGIDTSSVSRIVISAPAHTTILSRRHGQWTIGGNRHKPADAHAIRAFLDTFHIPEKNTRAITHSWQIARCMGEPASQSLITLHDSGGAAILTARAGSGSLPFQDGVCMQTSGSGTTIFTSHIKLYQLSQAPSQWLNRAIFSLDPHGITGITIKRKGACRETATRFLAPDATDTIPIRTYNCTGSSETIAFTRDSYKSPWRCHRRRHLAPNQQLLDHIIRTAAHLRAIRISPDQRPGTTGTAIPDTLVTLTLDSGSSRTLAIGHPAGTNKFYAQAGPHSPIYIISGYQNRLFQIPLTQMTHPAKPRRRHSIPAAATQTVPIPDQSGASVAEPSQPAPSENALPTPGTDTSPAPPPQEPPAESRQ